MSLYLSAKTEIKMLHLENCGLSETSIRKFFTNDLKIMKSLNYLNMS